MIEAKCPVCGKPFAVDTLADLPSFPFCSDRCRLIDLGRWLDGAYTIPGPESPPEDQPETPPGGRPEG